MRRQIKVVILSELISTLLSGSISAQTRRTVQSVSEAKHSLVLSLPDRKMALLENGSVKKVYVIAVGKKSTPSPIGTFTIVSRLNNPTYSHRGRIVAPGPDNPVGTRWMGLSVNGYGIHGTNAPKSIGKAASHGCIRMAKVDLEELFDAVRTGDQVEIIGERNAETAELFGDAEQTTASAVIETAAVEQIAPAARARSMPAAVGIAPLGQ
jgi:lipoprotein-anchoring transpeptidase ErfK/SrfK